MTAVHSSGLVESQTVNFSETTFRHFQDLARARRAVPIGIVVTLVTLFRMGGRPGRLDEAFSVGFLIAMLVDLWQFNREAYRLGAEETRVLFGHERARRQRLIARTVVFTFMSIGVLSLSIQDLHHAKGALPEWLRILVYFAAMFATWMQLHYGFGIHYAKAYFQLNPIARGDGVDPQGFIFEGDDPIFTDFLYVAFAVGLTYAMSDVTLEDARVRRTVWFHSLMSFLFYSTVISAVLNLFTSA